MLLPAILLTVQTAAPQPPVVPIAVVNVPRLVAESIAGKAASAAVDALRTEKNKAIAEKQSALQALMQKKALRIDIERAQVELQRMNEDAASDLGSLNDRLQTDFTNKLRPVLNTIAEEDHIGLILEFPQPQFIVWVTPAVDITTKVIQRLDAAEKPKP
jgi:Skp family chaperone for outer membrane proteins